MHYEQLRLFLFNDMKQHRHAHIRMTVDDITLYNEWYALKQENYICDVSYVRVFARA